MKRSLLATLFLAASTILAAAAYADADHKHEAPTAEAGASQNHETHCCKPAPNDIKWIHEATDHHHEHAKVPKKLPTKKSARKSARDMSQTAN